MTTEGVMVSRRLLIALMVAAAVGAALIAGVGAALLIRSGVSAPLSRAIAFPAIGLLMYPILKTRAAMREVEFPTPFWKWAIVWTVLMFASNLFVEPAIERLLG